MAFKISLLSDVAAFLKGTKSVEDAIDEVADSLDDMARETARDAEEASEKLERSFKDAFDTVKTEAKQTGRKVGDDLDDGATKAGEGIQGLKEEAGQSAREMAASFDGSAESITDMAQEIAAQAGVAFGPWGAAAGVAVGIGIGALTAHLTELSEQAAEAKQTAIELADELDEVNGDPQLVDWLDRIKTSLDEIVDKQEWFEFWQDDGGTTRFEKWNAGVKEFGLSWSRVTSAMTGDATSMDEVLKSLDSTISDLNDKQSGWGVGIDVQKAREAMDRAMQLRDGIVQEYEAVREGNEYYEARSQALDGLKAKQEAQTAATDAQADAERQAAQAAAEAQRASQQWADALTDHLSVADEGLDKFVKNGKLNLKAWADELTARVKDTKVIEDFSVNVAPKLSPEALAAFAALPAQTQTEIAKAYETGNKKDRKLVLKNLEAEAKVTVAPTSIDTKDAQTAADAAPIEVPTTIVTANLPSDVRAAADHAQREANQRSNEIQFTARLDDDDLQRQVNNAVARITTPVIYATVKPRKEVP